MEGGTGGRSTLAAMIARGVVGVYQFTLSPFLLWLGGPGAGCRFTPSCSRYFVEAVEAHGAAYGAWLGMKRICRCHPWGGCGCDPIPPRRAKLIR